MLKVNNVDLMCREYKLHVRGDLSHLETELISTEHQFSALTGCLLKGKCFSSCSCRFNLRLGRFFGCLGPLEAKVHLVRLAWRSGLCLVRNSVFCCISQLRADQPAPPEPALNFTVLFAQVLQGFYNTAHLQCACLGISMGAHSFCWKVGAKPKIPLRNLICRS